MSTFKNPTDPAAAVAAAPVERKLRFVFPIPEEARMFATDPKSITLEPLSVANEITSQRDAAAKNNPYVQIGYSLVEIDESPIDWATGERDRRIEAMSPLCRDLLADAFKSIHQVSKEKTASFLSGRRVKTT